MIHKMNQTTRHLQKFAKRNEDTQHINRQVWHLLTNPATYINAWGNISANKGAHTKGVKEDTEDNKIFGLTQAMCIAEAIKTGKYEPKPSRRTLIPKPGKDRPLAIPTQRDKIVQEALRGILDCVYEPEFKKWKEETNYLSTNFGFRRNKSTWDAITNISAKAQGTTWVIEGDFKNAYNSINQKRLLKIINLINKFLRAGYMHEKKFKHTLTGTPQGSIISPILFNIYLFEMDKHIYNIYITHYTEKTRWNPVPEIGKIKYAEKKLINQLKEQKKKTNPDKKLIKQLDKQRKSWEHKRIHFTPPPYSLLWNKTARINKRAVFTRFADDWILAISGTKQEVTQLRDEIASYCKKTLKLELNLEKTQVTNWTDGIKFLGFKIQRPVNKKASRIITYKKRRLQNTTTRILTTRPDTDRIKQRILTNGFAKYKQQPKKLPYLFPTANIRMVKYSEYEIVEKYKQIFEGLSGYYRNLHEGTRASPEGMNYFSYIFQYSCAMTLARRRKSSIRKIFTEKGLSLTTHRKVLKDGRAVWETTQFNTLTNLKEMGRLTFLAK